MRHEFTVDKEVEFQACIAANQPCHAQRHCDPEMLVVLTGEDAAPYLVTEPA